VCVFPDGFEPYIPAAESVFGANIDYGQLIKIYASDETSRERYSPGEVIGTAVVDVTGNSDPNKVSTSFVERQNLTMRIEDQAADQIDEWVQRK
jgi:hypothetical protein